MDISEFSKLYIQLTRVNNENGLQALCESFSALCCFEYYIIGVICAGVSLSTPSITTITSYPTKWFSTYFGEEMQKSDPVVRYCLENTAPVQWNQLMLLENYVDPAGENVMRRAAELGLAAGLSIPLRSPTGEIAIFSLATSEPDGAVTRAEKILPYAQAFGTTLFESFAKINSAAEQQEEVLTVREKETLFWACEGKTTWEISKILDISERTVTYHLTGATKKLGAVNRQHAVARAIIRGLIKPTV